MAEAPRLSNQETIQAARLEKEIQSIKAKHEFDIKQLPDRSKLITFYMNINKLNSIPLIIHIPKQYPFAEPSYTFEPPEGFLSKDSYGIKKPISALLGEWNPGMRLSNIADNAIKQIQKGLVDKSILQIDQIYDSLGETKSLVLLLLFSVFVRVLVGLGSYSGEGHPPEFGDFEAQRNWMSISWNRPLKAWYNEPSEKPWWRLDYPPVAGYLSYICAVFMRLIHPQGLQEIRGYEDVSFKSFMRMTVLFTDIITFFIPTIVYHYFWKVNVNVSRLQGILILLLPPFILVDHGHFQYNCIMLGLVFAAYIALSQNKKRLTCILFTIALSTKQMSMYYALGFFAVLLGKAMYESRIINSLTYRFQSNPLNIMRFLIEVGKYGVIVIFVTYLLWLPWISFETPELILQPLQAIFPVHRGLYQLKVPNFWCVTDVFLKWESRFSNNTLVIFCGLLSFIASLPSIIVGIIMPNRNKLTRLVFLNISLAFFFFSYHVHEKTILVPLLFVGLTLHMFGNLALDFVVLSSFVMYHLLREDGLVLQYFVCNLAFLYFAQSSINTLHEMAPVTYEKSELEPVDNMMVKMGNTIILYFSHSYRKLRRLLYFLIILLHFCDEFVTPPEKLPYLFHLLFSTLGFVFFFSFWVISNIRMVTDTIHIIAASKKKKTE